MATDIKIIDRHNEPFNFKDVKSYEIYGGGVLAFEEQDGTRHVTNEEFHVTIKSEKK